MTMQAQSPQEKKFIVDTRDNNITKIGLEKKVKKKNVTEWSQISNLPLL